MKKEDWDKLLKKYLEGETSLPEEEKLREYFSEDDSKETDKPMTDIFAAFQEMGQLTGPEDLPGRIDTILSEEEYDRKKSAPVARLNGINLLIRVAAVLLLTVGGFAAGMWYANTGSSGKKALDADVLSARFEQASASERIKLIRTEYDKSGENSGMEQVLIQAMNNDDNVNVRLAAAEALFHFRSDPYVRKALIRSLANQTDPNVQITLIDMLVKMHEKSAISEMRVLLLKKDLNPIVRYKLENGVGALS